jgi:hypothetical protein
MNPRKRLFIVTASCVTLGLVLGPSMVNSVRLNLAGGIWCEFLQPGGQREIHYGAEACQIPAEIQADAAGK